VRKKDKKEVNEMSKEGNIWWKLGHIRGIYLHITLVLLFIAAMFGLPKPPPETISPYVQKTYDLIESLEPGDLVIFECRNDYAWYVTHIPGALGMIKHAISKKVRIIEYETANEGTMIFNYLILPVIKPLMDEMGYEYGKDFVRLGYFAGGDAVYSIMAEDPSDLGTDVYGTPIRELPAFDGFEDGSDIKLIMFTGYYLVPAIRQIVARHDTDMVACSHAGGLQWWYVYLQTGQLDGFIHGWSGGREYEHLIGQPGLGTFGSMAVSMGFYLCIVGIIITNVAYVGQLLTGGDEK